jgi:hypothetical protein
MILDIQVSKLGRNVDVKPYKEYGSLQLNGRPATEKMLSNREEERRPML